MSPLVYIILCLPIINADEQTDLINRVYTGLNQVLDYVLENRNEMNLDGLFGIVLTQAHLQSLLDENLDDYDKEKVLSLDDKAQRIYEFTKTRSFDSSFQNTLLHSILRPEIWERPIVFKSNELNPQSWNIGVPTAEGYIMYLKASNFTEKNSDKCILELITNHEKCEISEECKGIMIDDKRYDPAYGITHRLLYLQIANALQCNLNKEWFDAKKNSYCSYILWEANKNSELGFVPIITDLLFEQITLCGYEGFGEFFQADFIEYVLSVQTDHGCFTDRPNNVNSNRVKRNSNIIKYGCADHTTGLGASTLSLMLRYLLSSKL